MRKLRHIEPCSLVEVVGKTFQHRFLLRPSPELRQLFLGVLAKTQETYPGVEVHALTVLSNHYHMLVTPQDANVLARFMGYLQGNLATEIQRLYDWDGDVWRGRYHSLPVSDEPAAQVARLSYLLSNGCKEGLVSSPEMWPGIHSIHALRDGKPLQGIWYDRTGLSRARHRGEDVSLDDFAVPMTVELSPLPCWQEAGMSQRQRRDEVARLVRQIEREAAADRKARGVRPPSLVKLLTVKPHDRPKQPKRTPAPWIHAASREVRQAYRERYRRFVEAFYAARELLWNGVLDPPFPEGCHPPGLPFVRHTAIARAG